MIPTVGVLVILPTAAHMLIAVVKPSEAGAYDERDRLIDVRGERIGSYVLAVGTVAGIALAMVEAESFWIAQVLIGALVLAEIAGGATKLVLYR